jgi:hypothetical protein
MKKYINLLKKKYVFSALILLLIANACSEDVLKETPLDFLAPENAYNTVPGIQQGITGLHFSVRDAFFSGDNQDQYAILNGCGTDVAFHGETPGGNIKLVNYQNEMLPENMIFTFFWERSYSLIQRANVLIDRIKASDKTIWSSDAQKNAYLAEAMFFRAYAYRILVTFYGDVPLVTEPTKSAKTDYVRAPKAEIYKLMEEDLSFGVANLPARGKEEAPGRITQAAAGHYLAECYLAQGKNQQAADAASKVIENSGYALMTQRFGTTKDVFGKGDVFLDLFAYGNHNLSTNKEAIWVLQYEPIITGGYTFPGDRAWGPAYFRMGNTPDGKVAFRGELYLGSYTGYSDTLGRPVSWIRPTYYESNIIWKSDWNNDIRNAPHHIKRNFYYDNPASAYNKKKIDFSLYAKGSRDGLKDTCQYIYPYFLKHSDPLHHFTEPNRSGGGWTHKDYYVVRLAETILLRAEAYIGLGKKDLAAADINAIRNRANAAPVDASKVDINYLLDERARELYAEEWRPVTLRRTGKLLERVRKYNNNPVFPACNIQDYNVLFPIPQKQIDLNISAKMEQNPGYTK